MRVTTACFIWLHLLRHKIIRPNKKTKMKGDGPSKIQSQPTRFSFQIAFMQIHKHLLKLTLATLLVAILLSEGKADEHVLSKRPQPW